MSPGGALPRRAGDDGATWQRLAALWDQAAGLDTVARERFLLTLAGREPHLARELASLLAHHDGSCALDQPLLATPTAVEAVTPPLSDPWIGRQLGAYRLIEKLGEGGMSVVYRAVRNGAGFEQQVAVKLLRGPAGAELERRFLAERRILAQLEHPSIARLLDGGTDAQGVPYVVMEYVKGLPLTAWCSARRLGLGGRLELLREICGAVELAHRHLVVHRDLKPANILVDEDGRPRLLDFGIAKLLEPGGLDLDPTVTQLRALTPGYASPEQIAGRPVTTVSDVYALGVLLYELLTGEKPFAIAGKSPAEIQRSLEQAPPRPPSAVLLERGPAERWPVDARDVRGDLDTIVLKALRAEPDQRYPSAAALADDLERFRRGRPIHARPGSLGYRLGKFLRRNRLASTLGGLLLASLVAFGVTAAVQARRLERERDAAESQRQQAEEAARFLEGIFRLNDPRQQNVASLTTAELLARQREHVLTDLDHQPELQARLLTTLGVLYEHAALYDDARQLLEAGLRQREGLLGPEHVDTAETRQHLGMVLGLAGELPRALSELRHALASLEAQLPATDPRLVKARLSLGEIERENGELDHAEATLRRALEEPVALEPRTLADARSALANVLLLAGHFAEAKTLALAAAHDLEALAAPPSDLADAYNSLGEICRNRNELAEAETYLRRALATFPPAMRGSNEEGATYNNLGAVLRARGEYAAAAAAYEEALAVLLRLHGDEHHFVGTTRQNLAKLELELGDLGAAEKHARQALASLSHTLAPEHSRLGLAWRTLAEILRDQGRLAAARDAAERGADLLARAVDAPHPWLAASDETLGSILLALGRLPAAEAALERSLAAWEKTVGPRASGTADVRLSLATLAARRGHPEEERRLLGEAIEIYQQSLGADHPKVGLARLALAESDHRNGRPAEAREELLAALGILRRLPRDHPARQRAEALAVHPP